MMSHLEQAYQFDIQIRTHYPKDGVAVIADDFSGGVVYEKNGLKITAFEVDHGRVKPAFGYRIDYDGRSVVLSGDTCFNENVIGFSQGVDLLVHEVAATASELLQTSSNARIIAGKCLDQFIIGSRGRGVPSSQHKDHSQAQQRSQ